MSGPRREDDHASDAATGDLTALERVALLVLVALIPLRAVISETRTFEVARLLRHLDTPPGAMPATTMAIFAVILGAAVLVASVRIWRCGPRYRWTGAEIGMVLLAIAMLISTLRAGQKHLALTGSLDFLGLLLYLLTLRQLLVRPWHVRLVLIAILATGGMVAAKCAYQRGVEIPDTIRYYEEHKAEFTQDSGADERSAGMLHDFEQRMRSGAVSGYFQHPNVLASYLILIILTAAAVARSRWRRRAGWTLIAPVLIGFAALAALYLAQSKGAAAACGIALLIWIIGSHFVGAVRRRPVAIVAAFWVAFALGAVVLTTTLQSRPEALGRSMLFRSFYWQGASNLIRDQGLWGIGADNFGRYFTRYKSVECPEDVEDPHSWPVKALAEWGALGLLGILGVFVGVSLRLAKKTSSPDILPPAPDESSFESDNRGAGSIILWTGGIGGIVFGWWAVVLAGSSPDYTVLMLYLPAMCWVVGSIAVACESGASRFVADDAPGPMLAALCAGMIGFLIHTGIDLAMFQGGAATTFFAMMAVALAVRAPVWQPDPDRRAVRPAMGLCVAALGLFGIVAFIVSVIRPMTIVGAALQEARTGGKGDLWEEYQNSRGYQAYVRAADAWPLDGTALDELVEELSRRAATTEQVDFAMEFARMWQARDPQNASVHQYLAMFSFRLFSHTGDPEEMGRSLESMHRFVAAYPTSPNRRLALATLYEQLAPRVDSMDLRVLAAKELRAALDLDAQRIYVSAPNRLSPERRKEITNRLERLGG